LADEWLEQRYPAAGDAPDDLVDDEALVR